jgi:transposase
VLTTGCRWKDVPPELGCSGRTAHRRLRAWEEAGVWDRLHADLLAGLKRAGKLDLDTVIIDGVTVRAFGGGEATRALLRWLGIEPHIAKRKTPHGSGLGKVRWVVERTISWLKGLRRLRVRYDRRGVIIDAWATLAASVICFSSCTTTRREKVGRDGGLIQVSQSLNYIVLRLFQLVTVANQPYPFQEDLVAHSDPLLDDEEVIRLMLDDDCQWTRILTKLLNPNCYEV